MERKIRKPTQKRALEKMDKIINAAFKLFNEKGYYNTTTADIALEADVATGSVYAYFQDKKDIYMNVVRKINDKFIYPTMDFWVENTGKDLKDETTVKPLFNSFINMMIEYHDFSKIFQKELNALILLDEDIAALEKSYTDSRLKRIIETLNLLPITFKDEEHLELFAHYGNLLIDDLCHKLLYDETIKNRDLYVNNCVDMLYSLFIANTN